MWGVSERFWSIFGSIRQDTVFQHLFMGGAVSFQLLEICVSNQLVVTENVNTFEENQLILATIPHLYHINFPCGTL